MIGIAAPDRFTHHPFDREIVRSIKTLKPDNWHAVVFMIKDYMVIAAFIYLSLGISWWFYPVSVIMIGAHQRGLSTLLHDSAHGVLTRNRALNFLLGTIPTAWPIFQRYFAYRESHVLTHHPFLGRADRDPDLEFFIEEGVFQPRSNGAFFLRVVILPMLGSKTWAYLKYLIRNRYQMLVDTLGGKAGPRAGGRAIWQFEFDRWGFICFWVTSVTAAVVTGLAPYLVLFWVVPYITSFHIIGWFIEMSEHCSSIDGCPTNVLMARNRRSRHLEKWLTGINNDNYHLDHHLDPTTPFWLLPKAHRIRLRDDVYAAHCRETGGLFQTGRDGAPSIIALLRQQNRTRFNTTKQQHGAAA
ncbi:fatty acid desaturase family protein [Bradyrhizobium sp. SZCCHNRI1003]|uniref:fatty acid desaturase family protein n=1 Tax=Bradyrhizobium sp. SZCCHNRI1003 TaxID=3057275 RepID=UPI002915CBF4|nr:fatty acid desaturase family protein [Bradyrhizobium sp. SZCCHNRI1003]